jgi:hypothetical protein
LIDRLRNIRASDVPAIIGFLFGVFIVVSILLTGNRDRLEVVATAFRNPDEPSPPAAKDGTAPAAVARSWRIEGRVLSDNRPVEGAIVWVVASDPSGNVHSPKSVRTTAEGEFEIPTVNSTGDVAELRVTATRPGGTLRASDQGTTTLFAGGDRSRMLRLSQFDVSWLIWVPVICFLVSLIWVAVASTQKLTGRLSVYGPFAITLILIIAAIWLLVVSIMQFNTTVPNGEVRTLGFVNFYQGTYVREVQPEWLISFTSPPPDAILPKGVMKIGGGGQSGHRAAPGNRVWGPVLGYVRIRPRVRHADDRVHH